MKGPKSYTAEDVVEIQCHGSVVSLRKILELVYRMGARPAEPGEFTKRAFLNGRLDLSQAEAVMDLISARQDNAFEIALNQLEGSFSSEIADIRGMILDALVDITVNIDYPDEDIEILTYDKLKSGLENIKGKIEKMLETSDTGRILKEGLYISIVGKPNVGKSSLMNRLLKESRAIVTDIPGTTRDTISEFLQIKGIPVNLVDTAGIRDTDDVIEKIGIERSKESFNKSDLVILMIDGSCRLEDEDMMLIDAVKNKKALVIVNKMDKDQAGCEEYIRNCLGDTKIINASMVSGDGIGEIEDYIEEMVFGGKIKQNESSFVTNARHKKLLMDALDDISSAYFGAESMQPMELIEIDVNSAYENLGFIIGESVSEDIINEVFSRFCLGK